MGPQICAMELSEEGQRDWSSMIGAFRHSSEREGICTIFFVGLLSFFKKK